jgi:LysR family glycine cleavage system transcriptional activator
MLIHSEVNLYSWRDWQRDHPSVALNLERGLRFDRSFMSISAAIDGLGVCLESRLLVERELASGALVMPLGDEGPLIHCHSLLYLEGRARLPKMRLFRDWLLRTLNDE